MFDFLCLCINSNGSGAVSFIYFWMIIKIIKEQRHIWEIGSRVDRYFEVVYD